MIELKEKKKLAIIGGTKLALQIAIKIVKYSKQYKVYIFNEIDGYGLDCSNFGNVYNKNMPNFKFESYKKKELLDLGITKIFEKIEISDIDGDKNEILFIESINGKSINSTFKFDYLLYADMPFEFSKSHKLLYKDIPNLINLGRQKHLMQYKNSFFQDFKKCVIIGGSYSGIKLAVNLARAGKTVHLIINEKHLIRNIWNNHLENEVIHDLQSLKVNIVINPKNIQYSYHKDSERVKSVFVDLGNKVNELKIDVLFIAKAKINTNFCSITKFGDLDYTYNKKYGVKRLITNNLQLNKKNMYAIGIGAIDKNELDQYPISDQWDDFLKNVEMSNKTMIHKFLSLVISNQLGKTYENDHFITKMPYVDEFIYQGVLLKFLQIGKSFNEISRTSRADYGVIEIFKNSEHYLGVRCYFELILKIDTEVIEGFYFKITGPKQGVLSKVFEDYFSFATGFKQVIYSGMSIGDLLHTEFKLRKPPEIISEFWELFYLELTSLSRKK